MWKLFAGVILFFLWGRAYCSHFYFLNSLVRIKI